MPPAAAFAAPAATIDVREIAPHDRHAAVFAAFRALPLGATLDLVADHDPRPLYHRFQAELPGSFAWLYAGNGPEVWHVSITKLGRAYGAGECCGACGGHG